MFEELEMMILLFFTYSFFGWFMESVGGILKVKKFVNRGFLIGPYCPVYGLGVVAITLLLNKYTDDIFALFILATVICGSLEYFTSFTMEKIFNARWWDYSQKRFNINGRICLETLIPFGIAGTLILCYLNPFFLNLFYNIPILQRHIITVSLCVIFGIDFIISFKIILSFKGTTYIENDNTEEISTKVKDKTEEMVKQAESDVILFTRKLRLKKLKMQKNAVYRRKKISNAKNYNLQELISKIDNRRKMFSSKIENRKELINEQIKLVKNKYEEKIDSEIKRRKEEFVKQSILKKRLIEAFPTMEIKKRNKREAKNERRIK